MTRQKFKKKKATTGQRRSGDGAKLLHVFFEMVAVNILKILKQFSIPFTFTLSDSSGCFSQFSPLFAASR